MTIIIKDGTTIICTETEELFGNVYNTETPLTAEVLSEENLSDVTIDGVNKGFMILDFLSPDGLQFYLREPSKQEEQIHTVQEQVQEVVSEPTFVHIRATQTGVVVPAKERTNVKIPLTDIPEGYVFGAYRGVALGGQGTGFHKCAFQMFDSSDGGTKANISIVNFSEEEVTVDVNVTIMFMRDFGGSK